MAAVTKPDRPAANPKPVRAKNAHSKGSAAGAANKKKKRRFPELEEIESELERLNQKGKYRRALLSTVGTLAVVAAIAVLVATLFLPVLQVTGTSMEPNLYAGDIIVGVKTNGFELGQVCSFYFNNKLVLKRVIGTPGDWINIDDNGRVYVNNVLLEEPYVQEYAKGICDIEFPYQVPDGKIFVLGDNRSDSIDSRSTSVGSVAVDEVVGKILWRVWPLNKIGYLGGI
ncbi:MAG: signal peptidase I [Clostridia bacterium]|nr:signal peptidase I [Clostridia bacterium]